ncbi:fimbria/pilus outer membrane usher protein [Pandoraea bronchicola]|uniref:Fimbrial biogenesis outer membrane usher protein n=1 Tax=Pandoraea bronchicola TaxID=2508287 RepID=A0A5E5BPP4_9BURK|nr:fimbria/pilus outer membrane usher protein [Pandoraea bronchicola]VVE87112.1 fimbrial biogenesis outer membrane usher protein [Pandoraea bronchicola]
MASASRVRVRRAPAVAPSRRPRSIALPQWAKAASDAAATVVATTMTLGITTFGTTGDVHAAPPAVVTGDGRRKTPDISGTTSFDDIALTASAAAPSPRAGNVSRLDGRYVLEVIVNGEPTGQLAPAVRRQGRWFVRAGDLRAIGLTSDRLPTTDGTEIALDSLDGVRSTYDAARQTLALQVSDAWLAPYRLGSPAPVVVSATSGTGVLINYDGYVQRDRFTRASVWSEVRGFWSGGTVRQTGIVEHSPWRRGYRRYDTWWQHDDPARLTSWTAGDLITGSLSWTRSLRIAGLQWRRNFSLRPDLVTFPIPALRGSAVVPSSVDLYLDGVRRMGGRVPPGPFVIQEAPGLTGDLQASVVTRDALGREQITTVPLYIDPRLLARGLSSFSVEAGLPRDDYGVRSFSYRRRPVASLAARCGATDSVTVEAQAQAGQRLALGGAGALMTLGSAGVVSASAAVSGGRGTGSQWSAGYQYLSRRLSIDAQVIRTTGHYRDIASLDDVPAPRASDRVSVSVPFARASTASLSWFAQRVPRQPATRVLSASLSLPAGTRGMLSVGGFRDFARRRAHGVFAMLSVLLGGSALGSTSFNQQDGQTQAWVGASRPPDYGGGWGWQVLGGHAFSQRTVQGELQYLGRHGQFSALAQQVGHQTAASLGMTGALVVMDKGVHATRRTYDAFALVSTDGQPDIPVLRESVPIGHTDSRGYFLVPDLNGFEAARIDIDPMHLSADLEVVTTERRIAPQAGSGVLVRFPVRRYRAALVTLVNASGQPLRPGTSVRHVQSGAITVVGYDGEVFIDALEPRNTLESRDGRQRCRVSFDWTMPPEGQMARVGPLECIVFGTLAEERPAPSPPAEPSSPPPSVQEDHS